MRSGNLITIGPTNLIIAKPILEKLDISNVEYKIELTKESSDVAPEKDLFGLPSKLYAVRIILTEDDFLKHEFLFKEHGFNRTLENSDPIELKTTIENNSSLPNQPEFFLLFGFKFHPSVDVFLFTTFLLSVWFREYSRIARIYLVAYLVIRILNWLYKKLKKIS